MIHWNGKESEFCSDTGAQFLMTLYGNPDFTWDLSPFLDIPLAKGQLWKGSFYAKATRAGLQQLPHPLSILGHQDSFGEHTTPFIYLKGRFSERKDRSLPLTGLLPHMATTTRTELIQSWESWSSSGSPTWVRGTTGVDYHLLLSQVLSVELYQKWSIWDVNTGAHMGYWYSKVVD